MIDANNLLYCLNVDDECPKMFIDTHIGYDEEDVQGINGSQFAKELMYLDSLGKQGIEIVINSPGGVIVDGMSIYHAIRAAQTPITTRCIFAASISAVIFEAGDNRVIEDFGIYMIHNPSGSDDKSLKNFKEAILVMIGRTGISEETLSKLMDDESWFNGNDEKYLGVFWDEVNETEKKIATKDVKARYKELTLITNSIKNKIMENTKKVNTEDSKNEDIEAKLAKMIEDLEEKFNKRCEDLEDKFSKKAEDKKNEVDYKAKCEDLEAKLAKNEDDEDGDEEEEEEEDKKGKVKNFLDEAVKSGKIVNDEAVKNYWKNQLIYDFEGTKATVNSFKSNAKGVDIAKTITTPIVTNSVESLVSSKLREIQAENLKKYEIK